MAKIADKDKVIICPKCRHNIYVWKGQEEPAKCPECGAWL